jgi:hypothetical protein
LRVLFVKNVPYPIRIYPAHHEIRTVAEQGWNRLTNADLFKAAEAERFDVMVTADQNIPYQQNLKNRVIAVVVLGTNQLALLEEDPSKIVRAVDGIGVGSVEFVNYTHPRKPKPGVGFS